MIIIKKSGEIETFKSKKIYRSVIDAGGSKQLANDAEKKAKDIYFNGCSTQNISKIISEFLKIEPGVKERYGLKNAIMKLGPTGFPFEKYFSKVLKYHGYKTIMNAKLKGKNVLHEIDIIAENKEKFMVECKYHNQVGTITRLHPAMYTYARFLDLGKYNFDHPWLVTNTKCSLDARKYARGVKLKITGWNYPKNQSLQKLIEKEGLYPVTILNNITEKLKFKLFDHNILTLKDFISHSKDELKRILNLSENKILELLKNANEILV